VSPRTPALAQQSAEAELHLKWGPKRSNAEGSRRDHSLQKNRGAVREITSTEPKAHAQK